MDDVIVIEDRVDEQCMRHVHLMSNCDFSLTPTTPQGGAARLPLGEGMITREAGVWHYRAEYPYRGALDVACINGGANFRRLVVWNLDGYESVKLALYDAMREFSRLFGGMPVCAFMRRLPTGVENGYEIGLMSLMQAEWMLERAVAVGCKV